MNFYTELIRRHNWPPQWQTRMQTQAQIANDARSEKQRQRAIDLSESAPAKAVEVADVVEMMRRPW